MLEKHPMKLTLTRQDLLNEVVPVLIATEKKKKKKQISVIFEKGYFQRDIFKLTSCQGCR